MGAAIFVFPISMVSHSTGSSTSRPSRIGKAEFHGHIAQPLPLVRYGQPTSISSMPAGGVESGPRFETREPTRPNSHPPQPSITAEIPARTASGNAGMAPDWRGHPAPSDCRLRSVSQGPSRAAGMVMAAVNASPPMCPPLHSNPRVLVPLLAPHQQAALRHGHPTDPASETPSAAAQPHRKMAGEDSSHRRGAPSHAQALRHRLVHRDLCGHLPSCPARLSATPGSLRRRKRRRRFTSNTRTQEPEVCAASVWMVCRETGERCAREQANRIRPLGQLQPSSVNSMKSHAPADESSAAGRPRMPCHRLFHARDRFADDSNRGSGPALTALRPSSSRPMRLRMAAWLPSRPPSPQVGRCAAQSRPLRQYIHSNSPIPKIKCGSFTVMLQRCRLSGVPGCTAPAALRSASVAGMMVKLNLSWQINAPIALLPAFSLRACLVKSYSTNARAKTGDDHILTLSLLDDPRKAPSGPCPPRFLDDPLHCPVYPTHRQIEQSS